MFRKTLLVFSGNFLSSVLYFARNILVARLMGVEDYGIAATFAIVMAFIEMASQLGLQQLMVQDPDGDDPRFQAQMQGFHLLRSAIAAIALAVLSPWIAAFMRLPELAWAFQVLAIAIFARGFVHFDVIRLQRKMQFMQTAVREVAPILLSTLAVFPLALVFDDFRIMLWSIVLQDLFYSGITHLLAQRPYRVSISTDFVAKCFRFGWPLFLNGFLLFFLYQGERVLVAREFPIVVLGLFSMAWTVTSTPARVISRSLSTVFLPKLSREVERPGGLQSSTMTAVEASILAGLFIILVTIIVTGPVTIFLVGEDYSDMLPWLPALALASAFGLVGAISSIAFIAAGHTQLVLVTNFFRVWTLPGAWILVVNGAGIETVLASIILGELSACVVGYGLMARKLGITFRPVVFSLLLFSGVAVSVVLHWIAIDWGRSDPTTQQWTLLAVILGSIAALGSLQRLRSEGLRAVRSFRKL